MTNRRSQRRPAAPPAAPATPVPEQRPCYAYHRASLIQCCLEGGHELPHVIEFDDDEVYAPLPHVAVPAAAGSAPFGAPDAVREQIARAEAAWQARDEVKDQDALGQVTSPEDPGWDVVAPLGPGERPPTLRDADPAPTGGPCVACGHGPHPGVACPRNCGCYTYIP